MAAMGMVMDMATEAMEDTAGTVAMDVGMGAMAMVTVATVMVTAVMVATAGMGATVMAMVDMVDMVAMDADAAIQHDTSIM